MAESQHRESPTAVVDADAEMVDVDAVATSGKKSKAPPGGKNLLWKKLATDTEEGAVKGLDAWPLEGWSVSKHTKKDSFYFMCVQQSRALVGRPPPPSPPPLPRQ